MEDTFLPALMRLARLQREPIDRLELTEAVTAAGLTGTPSARLAAVTRRLGVRNARWRASPEMSDLPALLVDRDARWRILRGRDSHGRWVGEQLDADSRAWQETVWENVDDCRAANLRLSAPYRATRSPVLRLVLEEMLTHKAILLETAIGGVLLAFLGLLTSFYTMQVYDRVIPTGAMQTLLVLTGGILVALVLEYATRRLRAHLYERLVDAVDQRLARVVFLRFLSVRLDQIPDSVGTLAGQLRGYESVRTFLFALTSHLLVDAPFSAVFLLVIAAIAGPLAYIPLGFFILTLASGLWHAGRIRQLSRRQHAAANQKTGLLVETVEAAEIIKSAQGGWRMLNRWLASSDEARDIDLALRRLNERAQHGAMTLQQVAYVLLIAGGAWMSSRGELTLGALIACSILSGRVLNPVTQMGMQLTAWANVRAALQGLDAIWALEDDHHGQAQPVQVDALQGAYRFERVVCRRGGRSALEIPELRISPGERVGVLGPVGSGKTTLLRLLSGVYRPDEGRVWLDDIDLAHLSRPVLAEHLAYLPQDGRLLGGSLRDNLTLGMLDPGDEAILQAAKTTGLFESVIASHPKGLEREIPEGGAGLSGGQRQLVNLTRLFLRTPAVWLLDEPTASLDRNLEAHVRNAIKNRLRATDTLVLVTHKTELLRLVDRLIVVVNHKLVMDGPREAVLARLQGTVPSASSAPGGMVP
jgi:ATP-binding cassette subfamily C protein LapB